MAKEFYEHPKLFNNQLNVAMSSSFLYRHEVQATNTTLNIR